MAGFEIWGLFATGETGGLRNRARTGSRTRGENRPEPSGPAHPALPERRNVPFGKGAMCPRKGRNRPMSGPFRPGGRALPAGRRRTGAFAAGMAKVPELPKMAAKPGPIAAIFGKWFTSCWTCAWKCCREEHARRSLFIAGRAGRSTGRALSPPAWQCPRQITGALAFDRRSITTP